MRFSALSLGAGLLVGVIYSLLNVRSPAPPLVALIGLLGILLGEQIIPVGKQVLGGSALHVALERSQSTAHLFGMLPVRQCNSSVANAREDQSGAPNPSRPTSSCAAGGSRRSIVQIQW